MSKVYCGKCLKPAGRGKRVGTICECGGTYKMSSDETSNLVVGRVVIAPPPSNVQASNKIVDTSKVVVDTNKAVVDVVSKSAGIASEMEELGKAIAEAMGKYRGTESLIDAVRRLSSDHFNLIQANEKLTAEVEKLKAEIAEKSVVVAAEEPVQPTGPSRRGRGRTANAPQSASEPSMKCGPYCSILHQHAR